MPLLPALLSLLVPPLCAACRTAPTGSQALVCAGCLRHLPWLLHGCCPRCGLPRHGAGGCLPADSALARTWAPLSYEGVARDLVAALKFRGALALAGLMSAQVAANLPRAMGGTAVAVVPVPAHPIRRGRRGYDPAGLLAAGVAARLRLPLVAGLQRTDRSPGQVGKPRSTRTADGRIRVHARGRVPPRVLLVDDVHTTGATLETCARALREAGAQWVAGVAYARAVL